MHIAPDYRSDLFVKPEEAYRRILSRVQKWQEADPGERAKGTIWQARHHSSQTAPGNQVLSLVGERGGGKTWLLRHLAEKDRIISPHAVYLDLDERNSFSSASRYTQEIKDRIQEHCGSSRTILMLDTVPPDLDEDLRAFEKTVLWPHLTQHGSLVIMAQSHPLRVCWRVPALRGAERCHLPPFEEAQTNEQIKRLRKTNMSQGNLKTSRLQQASGGLPLLNYLLATRDQTESWNALLDYWLASVPEDDRAQVQSYLEIVCTLDTLDHAKIQKALDVYNRHQPEADAGRTHPGRIRNQLRKYRLARPMSDSPGRVVLVDSIQRATRETLGVRDSALYAELEAIA